MRIVTWNIHSAIGVDGRLSPARIARVLASLDADLIALQEVRAVPLVLDEARTIAGRLGMAYAFQQNIRRMRFRFGNAVLTRGTILSTAPVPLPGSAEPRGVLVADVSLDGERVLFAATHLGLDAHERAAQRDAIAGVLPPDARIVLAGDFNDLPAELGILAERLTLAGAVPSYPVPDAAAAIDLVLTSAHWRAERVETVPTDASDHLPVVVDLVPVSPLGIPS